MCAPPVATDRSYTLKGAVVVAGFVKPAREADALSPQDAVDVMTRIWFVVENPPTVPVS